MRPGLEDSIRSDAWALLKLGNYEQGKLLIQAWVSRMRPWYRLEAFADDDIGTGECPVRRIDALAAESNVLAGECVTAWAILNGDSPPIPLPQWMKNPITRTISLWQKEGDRWQAKLKNRRDMGKNWLPPKQQQEYEKWQETTIRRIVLNKKRESQVMSWHASHLKKTKADCILLEIKVSDQPQDLKIRSGEGDWYKLALLQGLAATSEVPAALDVDPGHAHVLVTIPF